MPYPKITFVPADNSNLCRNCFHCRTKDLQVFCKKGIWRKMGFQKYYTFGRGSRTFVEKCYQLPVNKVATKCKYYTDEFEKGREVWKDTGMVWEFGKWLFKLRRDRGIIL